MTVALGALLPSTGTATARNPNWTNSPASGPSPNASHTVGNLDGGECPPEVSPRGFGPVVLGGANFFAEVTLRNEADTADLVVNDYAADQMDWGGVLAIPAGLSPGTYPLRARCVSTVPQGESGGFGGPAVLGGEASTLFVYGDRSYIVVEEEESDPATPVQGEVAFTG
jgi:hypothetical protein